VPRKRVLAIASGGGHWQQLMLMRPAFEGQDVLFVTTMPGLAAQFDAAPARLVKDCNRNEKLAMIRTTLDLMGVLIRHRPHAIISTGALPGVIAMALGRVMGAKTIWVDSIANAEEMSMSGKLAARAATHRLSQWAHVAKAEGVEYAGSVL